MPRRKQVLSLAAGWLRAQSNAVANDLSSPSVSLGDASKFATRLLPCFQNQARPSGQGWSQTAGSGHIQASACLQHHHSFSTSAGRGASQDAQLDDRHGLGDTAEADRLTSQTDADEGMPQHTKKQQRQDDALEVLREKQHRDDTLAALKEESPVTLRIESFAKQGLRATHRGYRVIIPWSAVPRWHDGSAITFKDGGEFVGKEVEVDIQQWRGANIYTLRGSIVDPIIQRVLSKLKNNLVVELAVEGTNSGGIVSSYEQVKVFIPWSLVHPPQGLAGKGPFTPEELSEYYRNKKVKVLLQKDRARNGALLGNMVAPKITKTVAENAGKVVEVFVHQVLPAAGMMGSFDDMEVFVPRALVPQMSDGREATPEEHAEMYVGRSIPMQLFLHRLPNFQVHKLMGNIVGPKLQSVIDSKGGQVVRVRAIEAYDTGLYTAYEGIRVFIPNLFLPPGSDSMPEKQRLVGQDLEVVLKERGGTQRSTRPISSLQGNVRAALALRRRHGPTTPRR